MKYLIKSTMLLCIAWLLTACPEQQSEEPEPAAEPAVTAASPLAPEELAEHSLFSLEGLDGITPYAVKLSRFGTNLFSQYKLPNSTQLRCSVFEIADNEMTLISGITGLPDVTRPYLDAAPSELECLTIGSYQVEKSSVNDRIYAAGEKQARVIPFEIAPGIPEDRPFDDFYGLKPVYSWDGRDVVVPLKFTGVVVYTLDPPGMTYVDYPDFVEQSTGMALQTLPNQNGKRRVLFSIYKADLYEDDCRLFTLDLDSHEWTEIARLKWIVYQAGSPNLDNEPWLIAGSRGKQSAAETTRTPVYGMLDPASGVTRVLRSFGEPVWQIEVEPYGKYVVYLDRQRQALVRLNPATGELDYDPRWFNDEAKILSSVGCKTVLTWFRNILLKAEWSGHEDQEGFLE